MIDADRFIEYFNLNTTPEVLEELDKLIRSGRAYNIFKIYPKKGRPRWIEEPHSILKSIQRGILKGFTSKLNLPPHAHGLSGPYSTAKHHAILHNDDQASWILSIDIKNFFSTTNIDKLRLGLFELYGYDTMPEYVRTGLTALCMAPLGKEGEYILPTGAPTSPLLASIAAHPVDTSIITNLSQIRYSRYIDDIAISSRSWLQKYPTGLQKRVVEIINTYGYRVNHKKSRLMYRNSNRCKITGITVNSKYLIDRKLRNNLRAMMDQAARDNINPLKDPVIRGRLEWSKISPELYTKLIKYYNKRKIVWENR